MSFVPIKGQGGSGQLMNVERKEAGGRQIYEQAIGITHMRDITGLHQGEGGREGKNYVEDRI